MVDGPRPAGGLASGGTGPAARAADRHRARGAHLHAAPGDGGRISGRRPVRGGTAFPTSKATTTPSTVRTRSEVADVRTSIEASVSRPDSPAGRVRGSRRRGPSVHTLPIGRGRDRAGRSRNEPAAAAATEEAQPTTCQGPNSAPALPSFADGGRGHAPAVGCEHVVRARTGGRCHHIVPNLPGANAGARPCSVRPPYAACVARTALLGTRRGGRRCGVQTGVYGTRSPAPTRKGSPDVR